MRCTPELKSLLHYIKKQRGFVSLVDMWAMDYQGEKPEEVRPTPEHEAYIKGIEELRKIRVLCEQAPEHLREHLFYGIAQMAKYTMEKIDDYKRKSPQRR